MNAGKIRPLAICLFHHEGRILAAKGHDPLKNQVFYRPLGGGIEFGETAAETIARELWEEIKAEVTDLRYLGTLENIFTFNGVRGHEIVLVYDGRFVDERIYTRMNIGGHEDADDLAFTAHWLSIDDLRGENAPLLYPTGLLEMLGRK